MTQHCIIYPTPDGGIVILSPPASARRNVLATPAVYEDVVVPATDEEPERIERRQVQPAVYRPQTDAELLAWVAAKDVPSGLPYRVIPIADIPTDRRWRDAWTADFQAADGQGADYGAGTDWLVVEYDDATGVPCRAERRDPATNQVIAVRNLLTDEETAL